MYNVMIMRKFIFGFLSIFIFSVLRGQQIPAELEGMWMGTLQVGQELRIVFHFDIQDDSIVTVLDSPDQGVNGIPTESTSYDHGSIKINIPLIKGTYTGNYNADSNSISGVWIQTSPLPLVLKKTDLITQRTRPQDPVPPYSYRTEEVVFQNTKADSVFLHGTLTIPPGEGPFPAVVLVSGSGPQDRDEFLLGHRPFLVLSDHLTRRGIAVLRYDDRGFGASTGNYYTATSEDFAADAAAAVTYLSSRQDIPLSSIGIAGHSEGGMLAPMAAQMQKKTDFLVLLAGTGIPGDSLLMLQGDLIGKQMGFSDTTLYYMSAMRRGMIEITKSEMDAEKMYDALCGFARTFFPRIPAGSLQEIGISNTDTLYSVDFFASPWMHYFLNYDPAPALKKTKIPVLAVNGTKDLQVPAKENLEAIERALQQAGNKHYTIRQLDSLNHLFQRCTTGSPSEYAQIEETFDPQAMEVIAAWILSLEQ